MIKTNYNNRNKSLKLGALFLFPFALFGGIGLYKTSSTAEATEKYVRYYNQNVSLNNSDFQQGATPYAQGNSLSGWSAIETESNAKGMLIDVGKGTNTDDGNTDTTIFSANKDKYLLSSNPGSHGNDSRIMMINSKNKSTDKNVLSYKGYRSSSVTLEANSYYVFSVSAKALLNDDDSVCGSIYLNGLKDEKDNDILLGYENFTNSTWKEYYFFIATGSTSQTITLDLYLGTNSGERSSGAVFFDNVNITRHSQNGFMELAQNHKYNNVDKKLLRLDSLNSNDCVFLIDELKPTYQLIEGSENYNFNFEDDVASPLGEKWTIVTGGKDNAGAQIVDIRDITQRDFKNLTGYDYVGDNLSYSNNKALVMWTNNNEYASDGYVGVKSDDIFVEAHGIYKVSLQMKVAGMEKGSFTLQVKENDYIYTTYSSYISSNKDDKNYFELKSGKSSGISSNVTNSWTNDYQTVELYIKGHNLYNSFVNLEFWLGDSDTRANGCVVIDDVKVERALYSDYSSASNQLELKDSDKNNDTITNGRFNDTQNDGNEGKYPITVSGWSISKEDDKYNESGAIYLAGNEEYNRLYDGKYEWAGINPNSDNQTPNNVYMMFNNRPSYQSITSSGYALEANNYYQLSFNYYNQLFGEQTSSPIKVEIIDENDIVLFTKEVSSLDSWQNMVINLHTANQVSRTIKVRISLGTENNKVEGIAYLDDFDITTITEELFAAADNKAELDNFYLNTISAGRTVSDSPAYNLVVDEVYDSNFSTNDCGTIAGIVNGKDNVYGIENQNNLLVITNVVACSSSLKSNYKLKFEASKYYELSFDLATIFGNDAGTSDKDHKCKYGVKVQIDGFEAVTRLLGTQELATYKIYYYSETASSPNISFSLVSDCDNTSGTAIITNLNLTESNEYTYSNLANTSDFNKTLFKADVEDAKEEKPDADTTTETTSDDGSNLWLLIPSLIMAAALIIAIVGIFLRKIKIKKIEKIKKEAYDKKLRVNNNTLMLEAQKRRDKEVKDIQAAIEHLTNEKKHLEEEHKAYVKVQSEKNNGKLSREIERAFKKYNANVNRINQKINILKEKINYCMTADYLLSVERKVLMEQDEQATLEKRIRKSEAKKAKRAED